MSIKPDKVDQLLRQSGLWRASSIAGHHNRQNSSSGFAALDRHLPGGGWPADGITELLHEQQGIGEFRLLLPALARLSQASSRWIMLVNPPYIPYPPALLQAGVSMERLVVSRAGNRRDYLWTLEQTLGSGSCTAVIAWPSQLNPKDIRRLQVAGKEGGTWGILFRHERNAKTASPAELRILLKSVSPSKDASSLVVRILKRRGGWESEDICLQFDDQLHRPMPDFTELQVQLPAASFRQKRITSSPGKTRRAGRHQPSLRHD